jgi:hypothetical protein
MYSPKKINYHKYNIIKEKLLKSLSKVEIEKKRIINPVLPSIFKNLKIDKKFRFNMKYFLFYCKSKLQQRKK